MQLCRRTRTGWNAPKRYATSWSFTRPSRTTWNGISGSKACWNLTHSPAFKRSCCASKLGQGQIVSLECFLLPFPVLIAVLTSSKLEKMEQMRSIVLAILAAFFAQSSFAETVTYNCKMTKQDAHGWIAPGYVFRIDPKASAVMAASSYQDWTQARFKDRGNRGYRLIWNIDESMSAGGNVRVRYQANLKPSDNTVTVRMAFLQGNFANKPYGVGACSIEN